MFIVSLFDKVSKSFSPVSTVPSIPAFIRVLSDEINRPEPQEIWATHPDDFELFQVGDFDSDSGFVSFKLELVTQLSALKRS